MTVGIAWLRVKVGAWLRVTVVVASTVLGIFPENLLRGLPKFRMQFPVGCPGMWPENRGISTFWFQCLKEARGNCMRDCGGVESWEC